MEVHQWKVAKAMLEISVVLLASIIPFASIHVAIRR
jgi:hypothetical protein